MSAGTVTVALSKESPASTKRHYSLEKIKNLTSMKQLDKLVNMFDFS